MEQGLKRGEERGLKRGVEQGVELGSNQKLKDQVEKKLRKGLSVPEIADMLEEEPGVIAAIVEQIHAHEKGQQPTQRRQRCG